MTASGVRSRQCTRCWILEPQSHTVCLPLGHDGLHRSSCHEHPGGYKVRPINLMHLSVC